MDHEKDIYFERHRYWQDLAISQLSTANNFMLTISLGLLAFCFDKTVFINMKWCICTCKIDLSLTLHFISLIFLTFAIIYGMAVLVARLFDFRITRNIVLTRQRYYENNKKSISLEDEEIAKLPDDEFGYPNFTKRMNALYKVLFSEIELIKKEDSLKIKMDKQMLAKFNSLRELSFILGTISWRLPRYQAIYLGMATIFYIISLCI
ncbi:MAG: hypothetical protein J5I41_06100 [Saprospiraceae bacterium]|nr:hypothetical protein [Saprospiraceae bacterium]